MNTQEVFNKVCDHLMTQRISASDNSDRDLYRNKEGLSCAIGCLIPDTYYLPSMEGCSVPELLASYDLPSFMARDQELLERLQPVHDLYMPRTIKTYNCSISLVANTLQAIAMQFNLSLPVSVQKELKDA